MFYLRVSKVIGHVTSLMNDIIKQSVAYLDYNATAPLVPPARAAMIAAMEIIGNPSSIHSYGRAARKLVEDARAQVASLVGVRAAQVIFNGGATEGNNTILSGFRDRSVFVAAADHASVLDSAPHARRIPMTAHGMVDLAALHAMIQDEKPALISVHLVNNETGVIQPMAEVVKLGHDCGALVHCDAVQGAGRIDLDFHALGVDYMTLTAHKIGGPKGVGALIFKQGLQIPKFIHGGGQEKRQRAGTENTLGIAGFGAAAAFVKTNLSTYQKNCSAFQAALEKGLRQLANDCIILGDQAPRVANTTNVLLPGVMAETQIMAMDLAGIAVSSGSACSSGSVKASHVLISMGLSDDLAKSALRFSTGWATTMADIDAALHAYQTMLGRVRSIKT